MVIMKAYELMVRGKVQRVGYRRYLLGLAQELGLAGYVENRPDGTVHIFVQGPEEKLREFMDKAGSPIYPAKVTQLDMKEAKINPRYKYFTIKYGDLGEELQEGFGALQEIFMDYWKEFKDFRGEFSDFRGEFKNFRGEFKEFRGEFKDFRNEFSDFRNEFKEFRGEFRSFREEFRDFRDEFREYREEFREFAERTDGNFQTLMEKYGEISAKLTEIMNTLLEESKKTSQMLDTLRKESKETREILIKNLELLRQAVEKLGQKQ